MQSVHNRGLLVISVSHLRSCVGAGVYTGCKQPPEWPSTSATCWVIRYYGKFWDAYTQGPDILEFHLRSRPWGHHHTSSAHPPRCLVRCEWNSPRSFITSTRSASRALKRFSAVPLAVSQPFLSRSWAENGGKLGFWAAVRPFLALHNLKPILARCKRKKNTFKASCCGSSPIAIVVWR